jgi:hypothetical protein
VNVTVDMNSPSVQRASRNEQDLYSTTNCTAEPPNSFSVSGWHQNLSASVGDKNNGRLRGGVGVFSRNTIELSSVYRAHVLVVRKSSAVSKMPPIRTVPNQLDV